MEQRLFIHDQQVDLIRTGAHARVDEIPLAGTWDLAGPLDPESGTEMLRAALKRAAALMDRRKPVEIVVPDILFVCRVLTFDRVPVSLARRQELVNWKMQAFLPGLSDRYQIRYDVRGTRVLVAAMPTPVWQLVCGMVEDSLDNPYRMVPESVFLAERFLQEYQEGLLIAVRQRYITAVGIQQGFPVLIRSRLKVAGLSVSEEVDLIRNLLSEQCDGFMPDPLLLGDAGDVQGLKLPEGWDQ